MLQPTFCVCSSIYHYKHLHVHEHCRYFRAECMYIRDLCLECCFIIDCYSLVAITQGHFVYADTDDVFAYCRYIICRAIREKVRAAAASKLKNASTFSMGVCIKKVRDTLHGEGEGKELGTQYALASYHPKNRLQLPSL